MNYTMTLLFLQQEVITRLILRTLSDGRLGTATLFQEKSSKLIGPFLALYYHFCDRVCWEPHIFFLN